MSTDGGGAAGAGWPAGTGRIVLPRVDSTMAEAARRAPELTGTTWIMAAEQTAARGRQGRPWAMPPGNFAATLVLWPDTGPGGGPAQVALRSFVAALALYDTFVALTGERAPFALKWPNDVLLDGGKVAGILLETAPGGALLVGVGVNLAAAPDAADLPAGALTPVSLSGELGVEVSPAAFLDALAPAFAVWEGRLVEEGFAPVREAWLARAARLGEPIRARTGQRELSGVFETVDEAGHLVLATGEGREAIAAAEVFL
ncbi:biotin--[acetyl-CoA-carboxylase] ligase [Rhodovulum sp. 12E13]|uniref:biotin--[acetyl-CoA-carboxylase] ligase n=1 Tax=Rhodovulum sp. 12E13 TaxID=2203891 RepID=UPI002103E953|nr:biotin--[acetyl-CoA-carboxylase] ligase [Rhodovulum sp. 12E13]